MNLVSRNSSERYEVVFPVIAEKLPSLGNSFNYAMRCLLSLERRFQRNSDLFKQYIEFINVYIKLGHAHVVDSLKGTAKDVFICPTMLFSNPLVQTQN